jgi:excisionase family DNA binding protein
MYIEPNENIGLQMDINPLFDIPDDCILNPEQIAELLGVSLETVRRWCRTGKVSSYSFGGKYIIIGNDFKTFIKRSKKAPRY